ncbi:Structural maintenance of chromosomes protein 1 [Actinomortierella ambigua]|uniref:Structural maintenance of chromosomes protein n=1 Tax=Actinomortierella ambigua TaxID=1343610 RepID=A0A9P6QLL3_9FUNG|nr:Structural maintenance of chromosomes protein 1 [Actinomortierella ambigua]
MGRLHRIELENFKSYKGHQTIGPFNDFTCVIGPNGAGKSNLMDAISFVLGVKSAQLRSSQLRELIYRDRVEEGQARPGQSAGRGAVAGSSRAARESDADPRKAWVMAVYIDNDNREVRFTRSINMAGVSEFKINNKAMLYSDYDKQLRKYNILVKARNFLVFQGDVEAIASQSPKDLTRLLEQISGSLELKQEYDRLQLEQERAVENSTFNFQKKKGINAEIKQYQEQKAEAERYETLQEEKANLTVQYLLWKLFHIERNITETETAIHGKTDLLDPAQDQLKLAEKELANAKKEQALAQRETFRKERSITKRDKALGELNPEVLSLEEKISHVTKKLKTTQANGVTVQETHAKQAQVVATLESDLASVERMASKFEQKARALEEEAARGGAAGSGSSGVAMSAEDQAEYRSKKEEVALRTVVQSQQLSQLRRNIKGQKAETRKWVEEVEELKQQRGKLTEQEQQLTEHQQKMEVDLANTLQEQGRVQQELQHLSHERTRIEKSEVELNEKLTSVLNQLMEAKLDQRETEKEQKLKEVVKSLKRIFPGVHGRVTELCKPTQRKYDAAMAVILGRHMDAIVVDREKTAVECIQFLREQRSGHATFLPLDTLVVKPVNDRLRGLAKGARLAVDVVQYDGMLERAIQYVCSNTLVCDSVDVAKHICYELGQKVKAVALDGTVFHKSGLITGGTSGVGSGGARRWEEAAVDELKRRRDSILQQLNELAKSKKRGMPEETLKSELAGIESRLGFAREDLSATRRKLNGVREELQVVEAALAEKTPLADRATRDLAEQELQISAVEAVVHRVEDEVFGAFCTKIGVANIREYEEQKLKRQQELAEERSRYETLLSKLRNRLSFESLQLKETSERLARLESALQAETQRLDEFERERDELQASQADIRKEIRALQRELEQAQQRSQAKSDQVNQLKKQVTRAQKHVDQLMREIGTKESLVEKLDSERSSILRKCKLEQIEIPMTKGSLDSISMEDIDSIRRTSSGGGGHDDDMDVDEDVEQQQRRTSQTPKSQEWAIVIDFSDLDRDLRQALPMMADLSSSLGSSQDNAAGAMQRLSLTQSSQDTSMAEPEAPEGTMEKVENDFLDRLKKFSDEMERLAPSLRALERQDNIEARLRQTDREFSAARRSAKTIKEQFSVVKQERYDRFQQAFTHISERIDEIYKELTRSTAFPMGGTAYLSLEDTEEPYLDGVRYHAMPPLKRFRDMEQLSGGEKTIAALALLFAIHSYRPSPFFVLDEVDAALDNMNVARIGHYLQQHASPNLQFIVISLKNSLYERGQGLVGIYRDQEVNSSKTLTLQLDKYEE